MKALKVGVTCLAVLGSLALVRAQSSPQPAAVRNATPLSARHVNTFDLATYRELEKTDRRALGLILIAMRETVFYAQKSIGRPVICASPKPIPATELIKRVDKEIAAPSNPVIHRYTDNDQLAFIFVSAMKNANFCD